MTSVLRGVTEKALFCRFNDYCTASDGYEKIKSYAAFVSEIYKSRLSLTDYVLRLIFEDENVYVKARAHGDAVKDCVAESLRCELSVFEDFAALTPLDFKLDMGVDYVSPFESYRADFTKLYNQRTEDIKRVGYGIFSSHPMFRLSDGGEIEPIISRDKISLDSFVGYGEERGRVIENTLAFLAGRPAANTLLCGDAGTGKSSTVKAVANSLFDKGLRLIELRKDQLHYLPYVMGKVSENPLKFIIFIDDLSFNKSDDNFSMLKAALEGSASARADNAVIYATSNRRHIIKESFSDREGNDVHCNDTLQESLSLSERFGLVVLFSKPSRNLYLEIVHTLAERAGVTVPAAELDIMAEAFALRRGNRSARCAEQFVNSLL
jgi:predicted AAA+ superfamily ATPase